MSELKRHMNLFQLTMYGTGLILGAGIYVLIGEAAGFAGNSVWIAFALGSVVALFAGFSYAELSSIFPKAAAEYVFIKNAFKNNFFAFLIGCWTLIPTKLTMDKIINKLIAAIIIGIFTNSAKYPPNPNATVAAVIIDVTAVSQGQILSLQ